MTTDLLPNGPYALTLTALLGLATFATIVSEDRRHLFVVAVLMWGNWVFAQLSTDTGSIGVAAVGNLAAGVMLVLWRTEIALAIALLYVPRLFFLALGQFAIIPVWLMWEVSNAILILQITILAGGSINGTRSILARLLDLGGHALLKLPGAEIIKTQVLDPFGPVIRIDRPSVQRR